MQTLSPLPDWLLALTKQTGVFVTGTDTNVGKTWVGVSLIHQLRRCGLLVAPRKPVESGWVDPSKTDSWQLAEAAGCLSDLELVCSKRFKAALAPPRAAELEGETLTIQQLQRNCLSDVKHHFLYVEGAGGFYSPLAHDGLNADLAQALSLSVILVAEDKLGCINHTLLSVHAIQQRGLNLVAIILNRKQLVPIGMDNAQDLARYTNVPIYVWPMV